MKTKSHWFRNWVLPPMIVAAVAIAALEAYVRLAHVSRYSMSPPTAIVRSMLDPETDLYSALGWTALASVGGFIISALGGIGLAIALSAWPLLRRAIYPYTIFFQTVPIIAIAPMLVLWVGFGLQAVIVCVVIVSIFPVIVNTLSGLLSTDPALADLFHLYGASPIETMWKLRLPSALPAIFSGLRVAAGLAVIGAVVSEIIVGQTVGHAGLGVVINGGAHNLRLDRAMAGILLSCGLGMGMFGLVNLAARLTLRWWHASER